MNINERIRVLLRSIEPTTEEIAQVTNIKYSRWANVRKSTGRARAEEVEALCKLYPQYQMWIATGTVMPEAGQISPSEDD